jgi:hypothetical protein
VPDNRKQLSQKTFDKLASVLRKIRNRAAKAHDDETCGDADRALALLQRLTTDLIVEGRIPEAGPSTHS